MFKLPKTAHPWFALTVRHHHEKTVARALQCQGFPEFLPLYRSSYRSGAKSRPVDLPLFPNYVFCSFDTSQRFSVLGIPGVGSIVTIGKRPAEIPSYELERLSALIDSELPVEPWPYLEPGQEVLIDQGPLSGLAGTVVSCKGRYRIVVSVCLLQRSVSTEIDRAWVNPGKLLELPSLASIGHSVQFFEGDRDASRA